MKNFQKIKKSSSAIETLAIIRLLIWLYDKLKKKSYALKENVDDSVEQK